MGGLRAGKEMLFRKTIWVERVRADGQGAGGGKSSGPSESHCFLSVRPRDQVSQMGKLRQEPW